MKRYLWLAYFTVALYPAAAQSFELLDTGDVLKGAIGETIRAPIRIANTSDAPLTLIIKTTGAQLGSTQRIYFCHDGDCSDQSGQDVTVKLDPGQTLNSLTVALEAGLATTSSSVKFNIINKNNVAEYLEFELHFSVEEKLEKQSIYASRLITVHNLYPNPVSDHAFVDYTLHRDDIEARIVIHNILGNSIEAYPLPFSENKVKIGAGSLSAGIYFYTLYLDNEGVVTRKLIVKK